MQKLISTLFILVSSICATTLAQNSAPEHTAQLEQKWQDAHKRLPPPLQIQLKQFINSAKAAKSAGKDLKNVAGESAKEYSNKLPDNVGAQNQRFESIKKLNDLLTPNQALRTSLQTAKPGTLSKAQSELLENLELEVEFVIGFNEVMRKTMSSPPKRK